MGKSPKEIESIDELVNAATTSIFTEQTCSQTVNLEGFEFPVPIFGGGPKHYADEYLEHALVLLNSDSEPNLSDEHLVRHTLSAYLGFKRRYEEALPHAQRCVEISPEDPESQALVAKLLQELDRTEESARGYFLAARKTGLRHPIRTLNYARQGLQVRFSA